MKTLTTIYSQPSIEALEELISTFFKWYGLESKTRLEDLFYYGIFCAAGTYANYDWIGMGGYTEMEVPPVLTAPCSTSAERLDYVNGVIERVLKGEEDKPDWMRFIEMESSCNDYDQQPSNFLRLLPKEERHQDLADSLLNFLYSPNRTTVVYN